LLESDKKRELNQDIMKFRKKFNPWRKGGPLVSNLDESMISENTENNHEPDLSFIE
jgi:hypothetical protein